MRRLAVLTVACAILPASSASAATLHRRVRMLVYNQGNLVGGPFRLTRYPRSAAAIRAALRKKRFLGRP